MASSDSVEFRVEPEIDMDTETAVSFDVPESGSTEETQTYALVEVASDNDIKEETFSDGEEDTGEDLEIGVGMDAGGIEPESDQEGKTEEPAGSGAEEDEAQTAVYEEKTILKQTEEYVITVTYGPDAEIPEGSELTFRELRADSIEYDAHIAQTQEILDAALADAEEGVYAGPVSDREEGFFGVRSLIADPEGFDLLRAGQKRAPEIVLARFFDITIVNDGREVEPAAPVRVSIDLMNTEESLQSLQTADDPQVVHFGDEPEMMNADLSEDGIRFDATGFSVYGVVWTALDKTVLASDGKNYRVSVTCGPEAGIPNGAELEVRELTGGSSAYEAYAAAAESALGMTEGSAGYIRLFDIRIVDEKGEKVQPADGTTVDVRIELADLAGEDLSVVHFAEQENAGSAVEAETDGQAVCFEAEGFSVYAIVEAPAVNVFSPEELAQNSGKGFVLLYGAGNYITSSINGNSCFVETNDILQASVWYFEPEGVTADRYYIYTFVDGSKKYLHQKSGNNAVTILSWLTPKRRSTSVSRIP